MSQAWLGGPGPFSAPPTLLSPLLPSSPVPNELVEPAGLPPTPSISVDFFLSELLYCHSLGV